jgi:ABC-type Na+ transport system ATPase subunit NatA
MTSPVPIAEQRETPRPDPATVPALSIDDVSHAYGPRRALMDVSFNVQPASFTALLGLNGAGKSTLFSLITRLFGIQSGRVGIFGHDISKSPGEALRLLGVVFQPRTLDLDLSLTQNLLYHATHLFDEIMAGDDLVVLHQGKVLAQGPMSRVVAEAGAQDVNTAFMRLTGAQTLPGGGA